MTRVIRLAKAGSRASKAARLLRGPKGHNVQGAALQGLLQGGLGVEAATVLQALLCRCTATPEHRQSDRHWAPGVGAQFLHQRAHHLVGF